MEPTKKTVGQDDVLKALKMREAKMPWSAVIEATGFNGATLRPHITRHLQSKERLGRAAVKKGDRVDSPLAIVQPVSATKASVLSARKRGMAFYSIALALGISEAKVKGLAGPEGAARVYAKPAKAAKKAPAKAKAKKSTPKAKAIVTRQATPAELAPGNGRERSEAAAQKSE